MSSVTILYLDQNKWIELAQGRRSPTDFPAQREVLALLVEEANAGRLVVPLTATNRYETHKINIRERREHLAWVQSTLSQGMVFRGRYKRLEVEIIVTAGSGLKPWLKSVYAGEGARSRLKGFGRGRDTEDKAWDAGGIGVVV